MKAKLTYWNQFFIPKQLKNASDPDYPYAADICGDEVWEEDGKLHLVTNCGHTVFSNFTQVPGGWLALSDSELAEKNGTAYAVSATYEGAWNALNAMAGIDFPGCLKVEISSTFGEFPESWMYIRVREQLGLEGEKDQEYALQIPVEHLEKHGASFAPDTRQKIKELQANVLPQQDKLPEETESPERYLGPNTLAKLQTV